MEQERNRSSAKEAEFSLEWTGVFLSELDVMGNNSDYSTIWTEYVFCTAANSYLIWREKNWKYKIDTEFLT